MNLACTTERWANEVAGYTADGSLNLDTKPFEEWPDSDPLRQLCHTYAVTPTDLARILRGIGSELENSSMRRGYEEAWR